MSEAPLEPLSSEYLEYPQLREREDICIHVYIYIYVYILLVYPGKVRPHSTGGPCS